MAVPVVVPLGKSSGVTGAYEDSVEVVVFELLKCDSSGRVLLLLEDWVLFALLLVRFESAGRDSIESGFGSDLAAHVRVRIGSCTRVCRWYPVD